MEQRTGGDASTWRQPCKPHFWGHVCAVVSCSTWAVAAFVQKVIAVVLIFWLMVVVTACTARSSVPPEGPDVAPSAEISTAVSKGGTAQQTIPSPSNYRAQQMGSLENPALQEASGMAASRHRPDRFWVLNDGGDAARVYAIDPAGRDQGEVRLEGARNEDWEDMASFRWKGESYLLIADIGDNLAERSRYSLYYVREPQVPYPKAVPVNRVLEFIYEDGPRDAEAIAVDLARQRILILSKRDRPPRLYELPLFPERPGIQVARYLGTIPPLPQPSFGEILANPVLGKLGDVPTAMDISSDGLRLAVMTYRSILLFERGSGTDWEESLLHPPRELASHSLIQGEALAFDALGESIYYTSEQRPAPLWRLAPVWSDSTEQSLQQPAGTDATDKE